MFCVGMSWTLPFSWELVEIARLVPSAPVAVIVTEEALVVCHVSVTACPEATLLLLAEKLRVGTNFDEELPELAPQPVNAMSGNRAATNTRIFERTTSGPRAECGLLERAVPGCSRTPVGRSAGTYLEPGQKSNRRTGSKLDC